MGIVERVSGSAACRCGWRGAARLKEFEEPDDWGDWDGWDRRILRDELEGDLELVIASDKELHHREKHLKIWGERVYCSKCKQTVHLTADGVLPEHSYGGKACSNYGALPRVKVVNGGSPGGGKRR